MLEPMAQELTFIDQYSIEVKADRETAWQALIETFGASESRLFSLYARAIGVEPDRIQGDLNQVGSTRIGFRVSEARRPEHLELTGRHRFSNYLLAWDIGETGSGTTSLSATTRAEFPGIHGRAYRALVIDSGAHARITRRMLAAIARRASRR
jgi:hypothetical protein